MKFIMQFHTVHITELTELNCHLYLAPISPVGYIQHNIYHCLCYSSSSEIEKYILYVVTGT